MARAGGTATPISPGIVARVANAVRGAIQGVREAWFGPAQPMQPVAPEEVRGRAFDYPFGFNLTSGKPRGEQGESGIDFPTLRALADPTQGGLDLLRIAIERRKDEMESQRWTIRNRDGTDGGGKARGIEQDLRLPDGEHTFAQWARMLLEDLFVIDAPAIYLAPSTKGHKIPQVMDGATLKRLSGQDGRTPMPPDPAFQQVLHGLPAVDYTLDEIVYMPRNLRSHRFYGMSPVEQVLMTINIGIRRATSQLEYYTAGSVPDAVANVPETWNKDQVKDFQAWWDTVYDGNTAERRRLRFIPGGVGITTLLPDKLKDDFDEWVARIICFVFSLSPQALTKQMNRATAETAKQSAQETGLEPIKNWLKDTIDVVLLKAYGAPELEFWYQDEEITDPVDKATVTSLATGKKPWMTQDEARESYGLDPMTPEQKDELNPPPPPQLGPGVAGDEELPPDAGKLGKVRRSLRRFYRPAGP